MKKTHTLTHKAKKYLLEKNKIKWNFYWWDMWNKTEEIKQLANINDETNGIIIIYYVKLIIKKIYIDW